MPQDIGPNYTDSESLTVSTASVGFATTLNQKMTQALITVESQAIRFWLDGTAPTASVGHVAEAGATIILTSHSQITNFRAIRRDGADATLRISLGQ